jgi:cob(I)alamin adenosyltransferase
VPKIYTKTGDKGQTALLGGRRVPKHDARIEAYGTVDELNSWIGMILDHEIPGIERETLLRIQDRLFTTGSLLASDPGRSKTAVPELNDGDVEALEKEIDRMTEVLPPLKTFILPGGHPAASCCHVARCVCRRAERLVVALAENSPVEATVVRYLNRLSDYLFTLARFLLRHFGAEPVAWQPVRP